MLYNDVPPEPSIISSRLHRRGIVLSNLSGAGGFPGLNNRPDAGSATVKDAGGPVMKHVKVVLVFWGSAWTGSPTPSRDDVRNAVINILTGPYMAGLAQYDGIGGGSLAATVTIPSPDPQAPFSLAQVQAMVSNQLNLNALPRPTFSNEFFYCVFMPTGLLTSENNAIGEHFSFSQFGLNIPFAWIMNDGSLNFVTTVFSHELVEACSDPNLNTIIIETGPCPDPNTTCEIGDVCSSTSLVGGVQVQSYWSAADNRCIIPKNLLHAQVTGNPVLIQGRFLRPGNFEMACALDRGGLSHFSRVNSIDFVPWFGPEVFATNIGRFDAISMIQSNFRTGGPGNLELAALFQSEILYYWREDIPPFVWHGPEPMNGFQQQIFTGNPVLIQGRFEHRGNFEMVVPLASGGIAHYSRVNDSSGVPWFGPNIFGTDVGRFDAITMIQSNWTVGPKIGLLEVIARFGGDLLFYFREDRPPFKWWGPLPAAGFKPLLFTGNPVLIESRFGEGANFELIVPLASGGLAHYFRDINKTWSGPTVFAENVGRFDEISFIQSGFSSGGGIGNLELIARVGDDLLFYWREDAQPFTWFGPRVVATL
jgi:hypothetical protein